MTDRKNGRREVVAAARAWLADAKPAGRLDFIAEILDGYCRGCGTTRAERNGEIICHCEDDDDR